MQDVLLAPLSLPAVFATRCLLLLLLLLLMAIGQTNKNGPMKADSLVSNVVGASSEKDHPWIVFTAGAMGAGKSHTINW